MALQVELYYPFGGFDISYWYENIGSDNGLIESLGAWYPDVLVCYSNNDSTVDLPYLPNQWNFTTVPTVPISFGNPCYAIPVNNGIQEQSDNATIEIYPNPTTGELRITNYETGIKSVKVVNVLGETVMNGKWIIENGQCVVDMSGRAKGIYFVRVEDEKKNVKNGKVVVE